VMPPAARLPAGTITAPPGTPLPLPGISPLQQMAMRIARNREVLGLHFPSDSKAGLLLAQRTFDILMRCKYVNDGTNPDSLINRAKAEWWP